MTEPVPQPSPPEKPRTWRDSPWVRRLPLLVVAAIGILYFMPKMPHDVEVDYDLGTATLGLQKLDVSVLAEDGAAVHRTVLNGDDARHPIQHLRLAKGSYRAELKLEYADRVDRRATRFEVADADRVELDVSAR